MLLAVFIVFVLAIIWSAASAITYYVNEHGEELIGRKVNLRDLDINPISGTLNLHDLVVYKPNAQDTFVAFSTLKLNLDVWALTAEKYYVDRLWVDNMHLELAQDRGVFNFQDIIEKFSTEEDATDTATTEQEPLVFAIKNFSITQSHIIYNDASLPIPVDLNDFEVSLPNGYYSQRPEIHGKLSFVLNNAGTLGARLDYDQETEDFEAGLDIDHLDLKIIEPIVLQQLNLQKLDGELSTRLQLNGNAQNAVDVDVAGFVEFDHALLVDPQGERIAALANIKVFIDSLNAQKDFYAIRKIALTEPEGIFHLYEDGNNFLSIIKEDAVAEDSLHRPDSVETPAKNFFAEIAQQVAESMSSYKASNFLIDTFSIVQGHFAYEDHTLLTPFGYQISDFKVSATEFYFTKDSVPVQLDAILNGQGTLHLLAYLYPHELENLSVKLQVQDFNMVDIGPYFHHYLGRDVTSGSLSCTNTVSIRQQHLVADNHIVVDSLELGEKAKHELAVKIPLKTGVAALKDRKGVIELDVPVVGDLSDPNYKVGKTILNIFKNLLVKAATAPIRAIGKGKNKKESKEE